MKSISKKIVELFEKFKTEALVFLGAMFVTLLSYCTSALRYATDDQFILARYIDNIATGNGFVYNLGEKVLGSTTPFFTLLVAGIKYVFQITNTPSLVAGVNIVLLSLSAVFFYRIACYLISEKWSLLSTSIYILNSGVMIPQGMETPLFLLLFFVLINLLFSSRFVLSAVALSLLLLTRPDAGLVAMLVFIYWWQKEGLMKTFKYTLITIAVALPWLIFSTLYFGSFVPQSLVAKLHVNDIVNQASTQALAVQLSSISRIYWGNIFDPDNVSLQVFVNLLPIILFIFVWFKNKMNKDNWIILAISLAYFVSYSISNPVMFSWYTSQLEPAWILISFAGAVYLIGKIRKPWLIVFCIFILIIGPTFRWYKLAGNDKAGSKVASFETASQIKSALKPGEKIMVNNYGVIGYATGAYIIDPFGLINPDAARFYPIKDGCVDKTRQFVYPPKMIEEMKPDWLILSEEEVGDCFSQKGWFRMHYKPFVSDGKLVPNVWKLIKK